MKIQRHAAILRVVRERRIESQDELREALADEGFTVTQATLSRDIRELGLVKVADSEGRPYYTLPPETWQKSPPLQRLLPTLFVGAEGVGNLLLVKTLAGGAHPVAEAIDWEEWPEVLGTVAGDDTVLVISRDPDGGAGLAQRLLAMANQA